MKKIALLLCLFFVLSAVLSGCGSSVSDDNTRSSESVEFAANLKLGWNLGNTFDATGSSDLSSETSWGQPAATKELIEFIKDSGFTSIRIPVSWGLHTDSDYQIDAEWMTRVTQVVDWALDSGLYVIINSHHDCDYYYPTEENYDNAENYICTIWAQVAENFKDHDERLVFESMNEPRLMNTSKEWWFSSTDKEGMESIKCIVRLNQAFVDTVRTTGGFNETRYLMVPSNAASPANALNSAFEMPTDTANRIILSVHAYTPYDFTMNYPNGYSKWSSSKLSELDFMDSLNENFIQKGYGVVIGEFGATNKDNSDDRIAWAKDYTQKASGLGIPCFLWDNGGIDAGDENFGMIDRINLSVYFPEILDSMLENYR